MKVWRSLRSASFAFVLTFEKRILNILNTVDMSTEVENTKSSQHDANCLLHRALMKIYSNANFGFKPNLKVISTLMYLRFTLYFIIPWIFFLLFIVSPCVMLKH